jgi:hypothetical protein
MNGVSSTTVNTKLDGATIAYPWLPRLIAYVPPAEAIEQVNVTTNSFDAEQGAAGSASTNVQIKSGTNRLSGSVLAYHQDNAMTARDYFNHTQPLRNNLNQFGFTLGGPVVIPKIVNGKNKLFFFVDWERKMRSQNAEQPNLTIAGPLWRQGNFSNTTTTIYDPLTGDSTGHNRTPFPNNIIPAGRIDPAAVTMASLLPAPTRGTLSSNYDAFGDYTFNIDHWDAKITANPDAKSMVWGRYSISPMDIDTPQYFAQAGGDAFGGGQPGHAGGRIQNSAVGGTYTFSQTLVMDGNFGYTRQNQHDAGDVQNGNFGLDVLHIPGTNGPDPLQAGIPAFYFGGALANLGNGNTGSPFLFRDNQYTTALNFGKTKGAHSLRLGMEYNHSAINHFQPQGGTTGVARGAFTFNGELTALNGGPTPSSANIWADFMLGFPSQYGKVTQIVDPDSLRFSTWSLYGRDQWQVTKSLTVDYGLRWEHYPIYSHDHFGAARFDPATGKVLIGGEGGVPWDTGVDPGYRNFAPRIGLAWRLGTRMVVRGGYGISIDPDNFRNQRNAYPFDIYQTYSQPNAYQFVTVPGVTTQGSLRVGIPAITATPQPWGQIPDITQGVLFISPSTSTATFPADFHRGYIQSYNFVLERRFSATITGEAGYVGTHAVRTMTAVNINAANPGGGDAGRQLYPVLTADTLSYTPFGSQKYNSLQAKLTKQGGASQVGVRYTFSKNLNVGDDGDAGLQRNYPASARLDQGLAGFDRTHNLQIFHVYTLPFGKSGRVFTRGIMAKVAGGWMTSGILSRYSGTPFSIGASGASCNCPGQVQLADQVKQMVQILGGTDPNSPYFDPYAFAGVTAVRYGSSGRNILRGPGFFNLNMSLSRLFPLSEKLKLQFRGEAFNLTNTPSFANPGTAINNATFQNGRITDYGGYALVTSTVTDPRQLQVSATLRF